MNMSYIVADPFHHQKPVFRFRRPMGTKKKLLDNFNEEDSINPSEDAIKVFLRLKPTVNENNVAQVLDSRTLLFKMPPDLMQARNKLNLPDQYKYTFSHIYEPDTTQSQIYSGCVAPLIKDLFNGQHCLLFTYGTTNAGKTFTVLGTGDNPGIIPRTLTTVFKSISGKEYRSDLIKPDKFNSAIEVSENTLMDDRKFKEEILTWKSCQVDSKLHKTNSTVRSSVDEIFGESVFREMQKRLTNDTSIVEYTSESEDRFSVWVSFAEIYNEAVFDLLQPVTPNCKRKQLKLGHDNNKNYYVKDLKHVFVQSEEEAYKVLMFGKTNLQVAATGMNSRSSRSHCIFTIKLIKSPNVDHPERVVVSSFSICDLAGAERQKKTLNVGLRLKESQSINCSLHVLSRCFTIIRENQLSTEPKMIPFRDSKLTQLFKHALTGKEAVTMIVNVNPEHQLCEETQHVLKASAIAKHIVVQPRKVKVPKRETRQSMFANIVKHNRSTLIPWDSCVKNKALEQVLDEIPVNEETKQNEQEKIQEKYENLLSVIEEYKEKLKEERAKHNETKRNWIMKEEEIRREAKEEMIQFLEKAKQQEEQDSKRIEKVDKTNKRRLLTPEEHPAVKKFEAAGLDQSYELKDLQEEVKLQQKQLDGLTDLVNILKEEKKELGMELAFTKVNLSHREREIINLKAKIETFAEDSTIAEKYLALEKEMEEKLKIRDELLNEAKEDMLAELREKDDLAEEISKLEKELTEKEEQLLSQIEELKQESSDKEDQIDLLEARIENMEYMHEDELKTFKIKITEMEEEIARLKQEEGSSSHRSVLDLEKQLSTLMTQKEEVLCEKVSMEEQLNRLVEEYNTFKLESIERIKSLEKLNEENISLTVHDFEHKLKAKDEEIKKLNDELANKNQESEFNLSNMKKKEKEFDLLKSKLEKEITNLRCKLEEEDKTYAISDELKSKCQSLQEVLSKKSEEINSLQKVVESLTIDKKKLEEEYRSEIKSLEQSCKNQLKETTKLWDSQRAQGLENERLTKELSKVKNIVADLNKLLKGKEHELECCRNNLTSYERIQLPTLQSEVEVLRKELLEYKERCEDQKETIINMEKELASFQENQKEIVGKYEYNLKKTKEENESLKKEVSRVTTTFYKSTPTPKKILEKQLDELKEEIEDLRNQLEKKEKLCEKLQKENEKLCFQLATQERIVGGPNKENESVFSVKEEKQSKPARMKKLGVDFDIRRRAQSCEEDHYSSSDVDNKNPKSAPKARTRKTACSPATIPTITISETDDSKISGNKPTENKKKQSRKKLWDSTFNDGDQLGDDDQPMNIPEDSPGTYYRRILRNRSKK